MPRRRGAPREPTREELLDAIFGGSPPAREYVVEVQPILGGAFIASPGGEVKSGVGPVGIGVGVGKVSREVRRWVRAYCEATRGKAPEVDEKFFERGGRPGASGDFFGRMGEDAAYVLGVLARGAIFVSRKRRGMYLTCLPSGRRWVLSKIRRTMRSNAPIIKVPRGARPYWVLGIESEALARGIIKLVTTEVREEPPSYIA